MPQYIKYLAEVPYKLSQYLFQIAACFLTLIFRKVV